MKTTLRNKNLFSSYNIIRASVLFFAISGLLLLVIIFANHSEYLRLKIIANDKHASNFGQFFGGFVGTIFVITSTLLIILTIIKQNIDNNKNQAEVHFFKMLDYHNDNVKSLRVKHINSNNYERSTGRRAFVVFRLQLIELIKIVEKINKKLDLDLKKKQIIDIAYISFFYGIDYEWKDFLTRKLSMYNRNNEIVNHLLIYKGKLLKRGINIGRTNQTSLSSYFRNMYNSIKFIDENIILSLNEKKKLIKILRAQLSNPELYVLYLNVISRFGKNWIDNNYIKKYEFIKNIPRDYCGKYEPSKWFKISYEEDELN